MTEYFGHRNEIINERKIVRAYFWMEKSLLEIVDRECQAKMISRSAYIRWVLLNFNEGTVYQINEIYQEVVKRRLLEKL